MTTSDGLLSVGDALERLLAEFRPLESEVIHADLALGRVLAKAIVALIDLPPFANSSMDGYAVRAADVAAASSEAPVTLTVTADIPAGARPPAIALAPGSAARIMTGAPLPPGVDAVIPIEATDDARSSAGAPPPAKVRILNPVALGANVRLPGEDVRAGVEVLPAGHVVRPAEMAMLASLGRNEVAVIRKPRVAILSTGDELVEIAEPLAPGKIRDSNSYALAALVQTYGGTPIRVGIAPDRVAAVRERLGAALAQSADLILSSAGVSVGAFDVVKTVVQSEGSLDFWRVRMRPGKPLAFGQVRGVPFLGLPGNPVSAMVTFEIFARPAILKMSGRSSLAKPQVPARLLEEVSSDGRESYLRAVVQREGAVYTARLTGGQGSNLITSLTRANALVIVPAGVTRVRAGETLMAWMLHWPEQVF
ncbi:MAG: molybdopterin molybdotransferase MoeA [Chloroflexi bacterium]|nr:molybdopterin molybdotransferase MoeA [Chloroflexota bacterium]